MLDKALAPILASLVTAVLVSFGGMMYQHESSIRQMNRDIQAMRIKDYRQHIGVLRFHVERLTSSTSELDAVLDKDPGMLGPSGPLLLRIRLGELEIAREKLENYVEENKHYGEG